ncbi:hypothetical protein [Methanolobus bombayensis]|uniref:hypothetical protein n=1 Tax=Methanolobus bombayensis TaxID=38023 RepID=UPI001AE4E7EC|nr:hypothetical protein [Methanolobus bombayensis]MBP1909192.1 hypothetical protein [Methanolobus bombayensis]
MDDWDLYNDIYVSPASKSIITAKINEKYGIENIEITNLANVFDGEFLKNEYTKVNTVDSCLVNNIISVVREENFDSLIRTLKYIYPKELLKLVDYVCSKNPSGEKIMMLMFLEIVIWLKQEHIIYLKRKKLEKKSNSHAKEPYDPSTFSDFKSIEQKYLNGCDSNDFSDTSDFVTFYFGK